jgi:flagellar hook-basal body complex protein FliE
MIEPISAVGSYAAAGQTVATSSTEASGKSSFSGLLRNGMEHLQSSMERADTVMLDAINGKLESPHLLMVELEQARMSLQLAVEIRNRMIEGYQELLRMQV